MELTMRGVKYKCARCRRRSTGRAGLVSCPDCGDALQVVTYKGQRPARG